MNGLDSIIQFQHPPTDEVTRGLKLRRIWQLRGLARRTPESDHRTAGHVKSSVRQSRELLCATQDDIEIPANFHWRPACFCAQSHQLACWAVIAHYRVQLCESLKGGSAGSLRLGLIAGIRHNANIDSHMIFGILKPGKRR